MPRQEKGANPMQAAPKQQSSMDYSTPLREKAYRRWTFADEREAVKLLLAFNRFRLEGLTEHGAIAMVKIWLDEKEGRSYSGIDLEQHEMHADILAYQSGDRDD